MPYLMGISTAAHGAITSPTANQTIAVSANGGKINQIYQVDVYAYITGTVAAVDIDNLGIAGVSNVAGSNPTIVPVTPLQGISHFTARIQSNGVGSAQFLVKAIATATVGAIYNVTMFVNPVLDAEEFYE